LILKWSATEIIGIGVINTRGIQSYIEIISDRNHNFELVQSNHPGVADSKCSICGIVARYNSNQYYWIPFDSSWYNLFCKEYLLKSIL